MKKLLLSTMLVATTVGGFSQITWSRTLVGQSDWMVRKVTADTPYCTLARQYEAGAVMTVAQNADGEGTIALDFKRNAFDVTRPYPVVLTVDGIRRQYAVKPAVPSVIILRIGEDTSLLQAMQRSDVLNVTIDEEQFSLDLTGYKPAFDELYDCLGISPQDAVRLADKQPDLPPQISIDQTEKIDALLAENRRLTQELLARDRQQKQMIQASTDVPSVETEQLIARLEESEKENAELLVQIERLEADLIASRQSINPDLSIVLKQRDTQIIQLTTQNQSLKTALDAAQAQLATLNDVSAESAAMRERLARMETQAAVLKAERDEFQRKLVEEAGAEGEQVSRLQKNVADLQSRIAASNAEKQALQAQLRSTENATETQTQALQSRLVDMEAQIATFKAERNSYQAQLQSVTSGSAQNATLMQERIAQLEARIQSQTAEKQRFDQQMQNMRTSSVQGVEAMRLEMRNLESNLSALKAERDQYQAQVNRQTQELAMLKQREPEVIIREVIKEIPVTLPDMSASDAEIESRLAEAETMARSYQAERDEFRRLLQQERLRAREMAAQSDTAMVAELNQLEAEKTDLMQKLAMAQSQVAQAPSANDTAALEVNALRQRLRETQARLSDANNRASKLEENLALSKTQQQSAIADSGNVALLEARLKDMESRLVQMTSDKAALQAQLRQYQSTSANSNMDTSREQALVTARLQDMEQMLARTKAEKNRLRQEIGGMSADIATSRQQAQDYALMSARLQDMEGRLQTVLKEKSRIEKKFAEVGGQNIVQNDAEIESLRAQMRLMEGQVAKLNNEKATLNAELAKASEPITPSVDPRMRTLLGEATRRVQNMETDLVEMAEANAELQARLDAAQFQAEENKRLAMMKEQEDLKSLQSEIAALEAQNAMLRQDVTSFKQAAVETAKTTMIREEQAEQAKRLREKVQERRSLPDNEVKSMPLPEMAVTPQGRVQSMTQIGQKSMAALSGDEIRQIVMNASVPLTAGIDRINNVSGPDFAAFRWDTGVVFGSGEQSRLANISAFDNSVRQYINKTQSRCNGVFDQTVSDQVVSGVRIRIADIACVNNFGEGAAASVLFFTHRGMFYALAHEADMNTFQIAMDMRDRLLGSVSSVF